MDISDLVMKENMLQQQIDSIMGMGAQDEHYQNYILPNIDQDEAQFRMKKLLIMKEAI